MKTSKPVLAALAATLLLAAPALADDVGDAGSIVSLERYTTSADTYLTSHGRLALKSLDGTVSEYRWGGTACGSKVLEDADFAALQAAQNNKKMLVQPTTQPGQGLIKCLVGATFVEKKNLALMP